MNVSRFVLLVFSLALPASLSAQQKIDQRRASSSDPSVRIVGAFGSLRIIGWAHDSIAITGTVAKGARFDGAMGSGFGLPTRGAKWYVEAPTDAPTTATRLELRVPAKARVWAKAGSADIEVVGVTGGLDLNIVGGSIRVAGDPRELNIESMDGSVTIDGRAGWLRAKTAAGDIELKGGSEDAGLSTVSGAIRITGGTFERAKLEAVTGALIFAGDFARRATINLETHSGPIEIRFPQRPSVEVDAMTVTGTIENAITARPAVAGREGRGQEIGFTVGTGDARIVVRSFKGSIQLRVR